SAPANTYAASGGPSPVSRPLAEAAAPARGYAAAAAPPAGTLTAATLAQTAAGFEETAAELRHALGAARAEARASEVRPLRPLTTTRDLRDGGLPLPKRDRQSAHDAVEEERSE